MEVAGSTKTPHLKKANSVKDYSIVLLGQGGVGKSGQPLFSCSTRCNNPVAVTVVRWVLVLMNRLFVSSKTDDHKPTSKETVYEYKRGSSNTLREKKSGVRRSSLEFNIKM